jgi:asparagine synthase (glutamine-hydrolysing)
MTDSLTHRGPDDRGTYVDGQMGLGFRRLSILDLSPAGHQPMCNEDGTLWIVFNGEIYNFQELRPQLERRGHSFRSQTDTEVIIHAYEEYGTQCLEHLDGMFAFALWDSRKQQLFLARDRLGIKPLHYYYHDGVFLFGSEIKAILQHPSVSRETDYTALWEYFSLMQIPAPMTVYRHIRKAMPGEALLLSASGAMTSWYYWNPCIQEDYHPSEQDWEKEIYRLFEQSVRRHLVADVPVGIFLSGGFDSSSVAAMAAHVSADPVKTFSVSFADDKKLNEAPYQELVARHIHSQHHEFVATPDIFSAANLLVRECDEPFAVASIVPLYYISKLASEHVKVVLSGDGNDEIFAGYERRYKFADELEYLQVIPRTVWRSLKSLGGLIVPQSLSQKVPYRWALRLTEYGAMNADQRYDSTLSIMTTTQKMRLFHPDLGKQLDTSMRDKWGEYLSQKTFF